MLFLQAFCESINNQGWKIIKKKSTISNDEMVLFLFVKMLYVN